MLKSTLMWLSRRYYSFLLFTKAILRYPRMYGKMWSVMSEEYEKDGSVFKGKINAMPNWVPVKLRIAYRVVYIAWLSSNMEFSGGMVTMYRTTILGKVVNDLVGNMGRHGYLTDEVYNEFADREIKVGSGNFSGHGKVWDFYDIAFSEFKFEHPYKTVVNSLLNAGLITTQVHERYHPIAVRLDTILRDHNAIIYQGSLAYGLLNSYDDHYYRAKIDPEAAVTLKDLLTMEAPGR